MVEAPLSRDARRIRTTLATIIAVAGGLAIVEAWMALKAGSGGSGLWALAAVTVAFSLALLLPLRLVGRGELERAVYWTCANILCIQVAYLFLYPRAYAAITIASIVIVALALSFVTGRRLLRLVTAAWAVSAASVLWGNLGVPLLPVPESADVPIVVVAGLAAVTVGMVLLWQFAKHMNDALAESRAAHENLAAVHTQLKEIEGMKSRFINSAAHELNTPLTPVIIQLQLLKNDAAPRDARRTRSLEVLERNINRMSALVREMLEVARLQAGRLALKPMPFALRAVLQGAVDDYVGAAEAAGVTLVLDAGDDVVVLADAQRVGQVVSNLLSNAVRVTPAGGSIHVRLRSGPRAGFEIADTGVGLDDKQKAALFQPFARVHEELSGTAGLGLYICRGIVEEMGGHIQAESAGVGKGATFSVELPVPAAEGKPNPAEE